MGDWIPSIGMEVHAELETRSKMFCRCPVGFGGVPNSRTCPVCLGMPGALPVPNRAAVESVVRTALALNCTVATSSVFHRKNYFYPDLPKGYQISQYGDANPIGTNGWLEIPSKGGSKRINIRRVHLEEDTGKLIHLPNGGAGVDFNRAGVPLMEIVTEFPPDIVDADEAKEYLVQLRLILLYLSVSDCKMEEGSLRCEPNISVRKAGCETYGVKAELKNLNSFRSVLLGIEYEIKRQIAVIEAGGKVVQETRGWHEERLESFVQRSKEFEQDYRYFPDPDLAPMEFEASAIEALRSGLPELPRQKCRKYESELGLSSDEANVLVADPEWAGFFEEAVALGGEAKPISNWMNSDLAKLLNDEGIPARQSKVTPAHLVDLTKLVAGGAASGKMAKELLKEIYRSGRMPSEVARESGKTQVSDLSQIEVWVREAIAANPGAVEKIRIGQSGVTGFLVGKVMQASEGTANPKLVQDVLAKVLEQE